MATSGAKGKQEVQKSPKGTFIKFDELVGKGSFKRVYKGQDCERGNLVAWNEIDISKWGAEQRARVLKEVNFLRTLRHPNLIKFFGAWLSEDKTKVIFITELMSSGTLKEFCRRYPVTRRHIRGFCRAILSCIDYLHTPETDSTKPAIIHRDIKCDNIFKSGHSIKIGDLGLATEAAKDVAKTVLGTPEFMAPEMYDEGGQYTASVDIHAFAMSVLEMITGGAPYRECGSFGALFRKITSGTPPDAYEQVNWVWPEAAEFIALAIGHRKEVGHSRTRSESEADMDDSGEDEEDDDDHFTGASASAVVWVRPTANELLTHAFVADVDPLLTDGQARQSPDTPVVDAPAASASSTADLATGSAGVADTGQAQPVSLAASSSSSAMGGADDVALTCDPSDAESVTSDSHEKARASEARTRIWDAAISTADMAKALEAAKAAVAEFMASRAKQRRETSGEPTPTPAEEQTTSTGSGSPDHHDDDDEDDEEDERLTPSEQRLLTQQRLEIGRKAAMMVLSKAVEEAGGDDIATTQTTPSAVASATTPVSTARPADGASPTSTASGKDDGGDSGVGSSSSKSQSPAESPNRTETLSPDPAAGGFTTTAATGAGQTGDASSRGASPDVTVTPTSQASASPPPQPAVNVGTEQVPVAIAVPEQSATDSGSDHHEHERTSSGVIPVDFGGAREASAEQVSTGGAAPGSSVSTATNDNTGAPASGPATATEDSSSTTHTPQPVQPVSRDVAGVAAATPLTPAFAATASSDPSQSGSVTPHPHQEHPIPVSRANSEGSTITNAATSVSDTPAFTPALAQLQLDPHETGEVLQPDVGDDDDKPLPAASGAMAVPGPITRVVPAVMAVIQATVAAPISVNSSPAIARTPFSDVQSPHMRSIPPDVHAAAGMGGGRGSALATRTGGAPAMTPLPASAGGQTIGVTTASPSGVIPPALPDTVPGSTTPASSTFAPSAASGVSHVPSTYPVQQGVMGQLTQSHEFAALVSRLDAMHHLLLRQQATMETMMAMMLSQQQFAPAHRIAPSSQPTGAAGWGQSLIAVTNSQGEAHFVPATSGGASSAATGIMASGTGIGMTQGAVLVPIHPMHGSAAGVSGSGLQHDQVTAGGVVVGGGASGAYPTHISPIDLRHHVGGGGSGAVGQATSSREAFPHQPGMSPTALSDGVVIAPGGAANEHFAADSAGADTGGGVAKDTVVSSSGHHHHKHHQHHHHKHPPAASSENGSTGQPIRSRAGSAHSGGTSGAVDGAAGLIIGGSGAGALGEAGAGLALFPVPASGADGFKGSISTATGSATAGTVSGSVGGGGAVPGDSITGGGKAGGQASGNGTAPNGSVVAGSVTQTGAGGSTAGAGGNGGVAGGSGAVAGGISGSGAAAGGQSGRSFKRLGLEALQEDAVGTSRLVTEQRTWLKGELAEGVISTGKQEAARSERTTLDELANSVVLHGMGSADDQTLPEEHRTLRNQLQGKLATVLDDATRNVSVALNSESKKMGSLAAEAAAMTTTFRERRLRAEAKLERIRKQVQADRQRRQKAADGAGGGATKANANAGRQRDLAKAMARLDQQVSAAQTSCAEELAKCNEVELQGMHSILQRRAKIIKEKEGKLLKERNVSVDKLMRVRKELVGVRIRGMGSDDDATAQHTDEVQARRRADLVLSHHVSNYAEEADRKLMAFEAIMERAGAVVGTPASRSVKTPVASAGGASAGAGGSMIGVSGSGTTNGGAGEARGTSGTNGGTVTSATGSLAGTGNGAGGSSMMGKGVSGVAAGSGSSDAAGSAMAEVLGKGLANSARMRATTESGIVGKVVATGGAIVTASKGGRSGMASPSGSADGQIDSRVHGAPGLDRRDSWNVASRGASYVAAASGGPAGQGSMSLTPMAMTSAIVGQTNTSSNGIALITPGAGPGMAGGTNDGAGGGSMVRRAVTPGVGAMVASTSGVLAGIQHGLSAHLDPTAAGFMAPQARAHMVAMPPHSGSTTDALTTISAPIGGVGFPEGVVAGRRTGSGSD